MEGRRTIKGSSGDYSEDALVEQPTIALLSSMGWRTSNCFYERFGPAGAIGRENSAEIVLIPRLRNALRRLNKKVPGMGIDLAIEALTRDRSAMSQARANQEIYRLLKEGSRSPTR